MAMPTHTLTTAVINLLYVFMDINLFGEPLKEASKAAKPAPKPPPGGVEREPGLAYSSGSPPRACVIVKDQNLVTMWHR